MEIETLSNYDQNRDGVDNTMDIQTNEEESVSPVNEVYEESTESQDPKQNDTDQVDQREATLMESESDEECEEEEEKLLLSPAHSDGGEPLSPVNRDLLDSDCEGEKDDCDEPISSVAGRECNKSSKTDSDVTNKESSVEKEVERDLVKKTNTLEAKDSDDNKLENRESNLKSPSNAEDKKNVESDQEEEASMVNPTEIQNNAKEKCEENLQDEELKDQKNNTEKEESEEKHQDMPVTDLDKTDKSCKTSNEHLADKKDNEEKTTEAETSNDEEKVAVSELEKVEEKKEVNDNTKKSNTEKPETDKDMPMNSEDDSNGDKKTKSKDKEDTSKNPKENDTSEENVLEVTNEDIDMETKNKDKQILSKDVKENENKVSEGTNEDVEMETENKDKECIPEDKKEDTSEKKVPEVKNNDVDSKKKNIDKDVISKDAKEDNKSEEKVPEVTSDEENRNESKQDVEDDSLQKENHLQMPEADDDIDMDEDFDPTLLMPELSMEVDEAPVITSSDGPAPEPDGNKSPLRLYDPIFSTFVDEMTGAEVDFDLSAEELELKIKTYGTTNPVQFTKIHCTACNIHLGSALDGQGNRFVHPLLKVLICKKCYHFYTSGEFEKDEDGSELYCRWCGQGGQVLCCAKCEMVFCKKCIRINFDRRKMTEIQRSDDWTCFRCNPSQLIHLRIHCAEFMEYVQREMRNVGSSGNPEAFMNTDYCQCCIPQKKEKKPAEPVAPASSRKRKRNITEEDPDYNPVVERDSPPPSSPATPTPPPNKMPALTPRPSTSTATPLSKPPTLRAVTPLQNRPRMPVVTAVRPQMPNVRPQSGFVRVAAGLRATTPTQVTSVRPPALRPLRPVAPTPKHEWFEKTVRAAARVNSNLSYTLTQLNRAQANATSVESLAVVHNKLQEILSSSINSLIQIRKNLRTEFIAGIKNIRFPPKTQPASTPQPSSSSKDDDDVIFIPSDPAPSTPPVTPKTTKAVQNTPNLPPGISLTKKTTSATTTPEAIAGPSGIKKNTNTTPSNTAETSSNVQPKGFLRVKSFLALQNVPSECITIPDDPVDDPDPEIEAVPEKDPLADDPPEKDGKNKDEKENDEDASRTNGMTNGDQDGGIAAISKFKEDDSVSQSSEGSEKSVKKAKIVLERSNEIDELVKNKFGVVNGESEKSEEN